MFAFVAARRTEPGEPGDKDWFGLLGIFRTKEEALARALALNEKGGYSDVRVCEMPTVAACGSTGKIV